MVTLRKETPYEEDIECKLINLQFKRVGKNKRLDSSYRRFHYSLALKDGAKHKAWYLTSYQDNQGIRFLMFDLDRHYSPGMMPHEKREVDHFFWMNIEKLTEYAQHKGIEVLWTTSPGDVYDGDHIQGLYAWIKLDRTVPVHLLRDRTTHLVEFLDLETIKGEYLESNTDEENRPIRLLGQRYVEVASVDVDKKCFSVVDPVVKAKSKTNMNLQRFLLAAQSWARLMPTDVSTLFDEAEEYLEERDLQEHKMLGESVQIKVASPIPSDGRQLELPPSDN